MRWLFFALLIAWPCALRADANPPQPVDDAVIVVDDNVTSGCWTNIKAVVNRTKLKAATHSIKTFYYNEDRDSFSKTRIHIWFVGDIATRDWCYGNLAFNVEQFLFIEDDVYVYKIFSRSTAIFNSKPFNSTALEFIDSAMDEWLVDGYERGYIKRP